MTILREYSQTSFHVLLWVNASRFPEACSSSDSWWSLCVEFCIWLPVRREVSFPIVWEPVHPVHLSVMFLGMSCRHLQWVSSILSYATRNCLLHEFSSRPSHTECCPYGESLSACIARPCNSSFDQLRLSGGIGSKSHICNFELGFPRIAQHVGSLMRPNSCALICFGVLLLVLSRHKFLSFEQFSSPLLLTIFTTHSFSIDWYVMMAQTLSAKNRSCVATSEFKTLHFVQIFNEFDNSPSSASLYL